jgi:hypothetical protein
MAFREVSVVQVREALRRWLSGDGERPIARGVGIDRKTARRYIAADAAPYVITKSRRQQPFPPDPFCGYRGSPFPWATREQRIGQLEAYLDAEDVDEATKLAAREAIAELTLPVER